MHACPHDTFNSFFLIHFHSRPCPAETHSWSYIIMCNSNILAFLVSVFIGVMLSIAQFGCLVKTDNKNRNKLLR